MQTNKQKQSVSGTDHWVSGMNSCRSSGCAQGLPSAAAQVTLVREKRGCQYSQDWWYWFRLLYHWISKKEEVEGLEGNRGGAGAGAGGPAGARLLSWACCSNIQTRWNICLLTIVWIVRGVPGMHAPGTLQIWADLGRVHWEWQSSGQ